MNARTHRGTIFLEDARLVAREEFPGEQFILRLESPCCARAATPGSFVHVTCDPSLPMRRPLSIMRADAKAGWIDLLFKVVGQGLRQLAGQPLGATLSVLGPIGRGYAAHAERPRALLIGGGVGIPPMLFLAESLKARRDVAFKPIVLMGS